MGPNRKRRTRQSAPYDLSIPENWTAAELKEELKKLNVQFVPSSRKSVLIAIYKDATSNDSAYTRAQGGHMGEEDSITHAQDNMRRDDAQGDQDGGLQSGNDQNKNSLAAAVLELSKIVKNLNQDVSELKGQVRNNNSQRTVPAAAGSEEQLTNSQSGTVHNRDDESREYTLQTAWANIRSTNEQSHNEGHTRIKTKYGYALESLPFVETVPPQLRKDIVKGKDINLITLLLPYYKVVGSSDKPDPRLRKQLTIAEFIQAFGIYKNIMCEAIEARRNELDLYERDIIDMAVKYGGSGFYEYHLQFSMKAAAHLKYNNTPVDWSVRDNSLFCNIFANKVPVTCQHCDSSSHGSAFCQSLTEPKDHKYSAAKKDRDGGAKPYQAYSGTNKMRCRYFNSHRGCAKEGCTFAHECAICKENHSRTRCPQAKNDGTQTVTHKRT